MKKLFKNASFTIATVLLAVPALAEQAPMKDQLAAIFTNSGGWIAMAAGLAIGIAALGGALGQGKAAAAALDGVARNPAASGKLTVPLVLSLALIESLVIYALLIAFQLAGAVVERAEWLKQSDDDDDDVLMGFYFSGKSRQLGHLG